MSQHYQIIDSFFDIYELSYATKTLNRAIITADTEKAWKHRPASDLLLFIEQLTGLIEAFCEITENFNYKTEIILPENQPNETWMLTQYHLYCGWCKDRTPWQFFPRHLSKKEFCNPYKALEKFSNYHTQKEWVAIVKEILSHALSNESISQFYYGSSYLVTTTHLHKVLEATHLIEVRSNDQPFPPRRKWKNPPAQPSATP